MNKQKNAYDEGVRFLHFRAYTMNGKKGAPAEIESRGGCTVAYRVTDDGNVRYSKAICSRFDNFNKRLARTIAHGKLRSDNHARVFVGGVEQFVENLSQKQKDAYGLRRKHEIQQLRLH